VTAAFRRVTLTAALRRLNYSQYGDVNQTHYAIQYMLTRALSTGLLIHHIPGTVSLGLQIFL
jgi:hypothetical protein